jgi:hypothetical protein
MLAWMFSNGQLTPAQFAQRAVAHGYKWAALEYDDPAFSPEDWWAPFRDACNGVGLLPGVWVTEGGNLYKTPGDAHFAIAEIEGPGDYEGVSLIIDGQGAGPLPTCSLAICTNFFFPATGAAKLIDAGFSCLTECYLNESDNLTPDQMDRVARAHGWTTSQPVFGVYPTVHTPVPPSYAQWQTWPGVDYLGEYVL